MSKVFVLGGTGFLGYYTTLELLRRGYQVKTIALPPLPADGLLPDEVDVTLGDLFAMSDAEITALLADCEGVMYAAGADERVVPEAPALSFYYHANVLPTQRLARLAKAAGVKHFVVFGSYFAEFAMRLRDTLPTLADQPYPNTRLLQEQVAFAEGEGGMAVTSLRLPYIFGTMPGRMPLWQMFVEQIRGKAVFPALPGGTAMVTVEQVAEAAVGAMINGKHRQTFAIGDTNMTYHDFYQMIVDALGQTATTQIPVLDYETVRPAYEQIDAATAAAGKEHGIHTAMVGQTQALKLYIDPADTKQVLGIRDHDVRAAIEESLAKCIKG
ncbi:NAD-dependent epimerase/dehydratase family protein [Lacticaseibacillus kribbianus]|uniref:NAD-dependent epimerase/dehydratase family protein n=1 Tax=Lacticaseibacillus kribbianus TaxID=2926292 RepID=UPI001CD4B5D9|nr:NAD-dependent epimerase/dehydratase family protein [Lacticaseibacillus kribbianus]